MFGREPSTAIIAVYNYPENGSELQAANAREQLQQGIPYLVESISMGQSSTSIKLKDIDSFFNSVHFDFFNEDGTPTDIYKREDVNPYYHIFGGQ